MTRRMKKFAAVVLSVCMCLANFMPAMAKGNDPVPGDQASTFNLSGEEGSVLIPFQKYWDDNDNAEEKRPESIQVTLTGTWTENGVQKTQTIERTVTAEGGWATEFDVSGFNPTCSYTISEAAVLGYHVSDYDDPDVKFSPHTIDSSGKIPECNKLDIVTSGIMKTMLIVKKGGNFLIWTPDGLTVKERELICANIQIGNGFPGHYDSNKVKFSSGRPTEDAPIKDTTWGMEIYTDHVVFDATHDWSLLWGGVYEKSSYEANSCYITNERNAGTLVVKKELAGNDPETETEFNFTVTLSDPSINGDKNADGKPYGVTFVNGAATFALKGGESLTINNLPN